MSHPARFLLVGTMNPEEGDLRPQLADRIGLRVAVEALADPDLRAEVIRRREAFTTDPDAFREAWVEAEDALAATLQQAHGRLGAVVVPPGAYRTIALLVVRAGVASHRADVTVLSAPRRWRCSQVTGRWDARSCWRQRCSLSAIACRSTRSTAARVSTSGCCAGSSMTCWTRRRKKKKRRARGHRD